jgi:hypothetical protein
MLPQTSNPYLIETSTKQIKEYTKPAADITATRIQQTGNDVELFHLGHLLYRLSGTFQGNLFQ